MKDIIMIENDYSLATDEELLNFWFEGDKAAFDCFFKRHVLKVCSYVLKRGVPRNDMNDVVQEVFMKLDKNIHHYEKGRKALPWFFTIVHNTCIDWLRKNMPIINKNINLGECQIFIKCEREKIIQEEEDWKEEKFEQVKIALNSLKLKERNLFEMRHNDGMSFKEMSNKIGKSETALRKAYERALKTIKIFLEKKSKE